jgi:hypothetical protein
MASNRYPPKLILLDADGDRDVARRAEGQDNLPYCAESLAFPIAAFDC